MSNKMLNLGAGNFLEIGEGWTNHDLTKHRPEIEITFDLNKFPYPLKDNEYDEVKLFDVLEHLDEPLKVVNEIHRILKPNGLLYIRVPSPKSEVGWDDLTHKKIYGIGAFDCLDPSTKRGQEYGYYSDRKWNITHRNYDRSNCLRFRMRKI